MTPITISGSVGRDGLRPAVLAAAEGDDAVSNGAGRLDQPRCRAVNGSNPNASSPICPQANAGAAIP